MKLIEMKPGTRVRVINPELWLPIESELDVFVGVTEVDDETGYCGFIRCDYDNEEYDFRGVETDVEVEILN